jgi:hypothetical protein
MTRFVPVPRASQSALPKSAKVLQLQPRIEGGLGHVVLDTLHLDGTFAKAARYAKCSVTVMFEIISGAPPLPSRPPSHQILPPPGADGSESTHSFVFGIPSSDDKVFSRCREPRNRSCRKVLKLWSCNLGPRAGSGTSFLMRCTSTELSQRPPLRAKHSVAVRLSSASGPRARLCRFWSGFCRKASSSGPTSDPKLSGPLAQTVWDRILVHSH